MRINVNTLDLLSNFHFSLAQCNTGSPWEAHSSIVLGQRRAMLAT